MQRVCIEHPQEGRQTLEVGSTQIVIGRLGGEADVELGDPLVSRRHARLWADAVGVWYEDLGSSNGSWVGNRRLSEPLLLAHDLEVVLGRETRLSLQMLDLPQGLQVRMEALVGSIGLTRELGTTSQESAVVYLEALYELTSRLLQAHELEFVPDTLRRVRELVPSARRIALVAWPPRPDGTFESIGEPVKGVSVSSSLARYAVEQGRALLLSPDTMPRAMADAPSIQLQRIQAAAYIPLQAESGRVLGLLCVDTPVHEEPIGKLDFQFLCAVAGLIAGKLASEALRLQALETQRVEARHEGLAAFLQIASHDLKNPLTAIDTCARLLKRVPPEKQGELIDTILSASSRATNLIRTYLDAAALESGKPLSVQKESCALRPLVEHESQFLQKAMGDRMRGIRIHNEVEDVMVEADPRKLAQILGNLLSNAIKYSPPNSEVWIDGTVRDGVARLSVRDQGVGISSEDQSRLFQAFERVGDRSLAAGSGLGLWLTAALVKAHDGRLGVESEPGHGSTFWVEWPCSS